MSAVSPDGRRSTRAVNAAETRQRLIDAAVKAFSDSSYDDVAVAEIAKVAGVAHGLLFHYFGSKRGIYLRAMRDAAQHMDKSFEQRTELAPAAQVRHGLATHLRYLATHRGLALRLALGGRGADPEAWEEFETTRRRALESILGLLGLDPANTALRMTGRAAVGAVDEATVTWLADEQSIDVETMVECMVAMLAAGLRAAAKLDPTLDVSAAQRALHHDHLTHHDV